METKNVPIESLVADPNNPRSDVTLRQEELVTSIRQYGIIVPLIGYLLGELVAIIDGHRRWSAGGILGLKHLPVYVFPTRPSEAQILATQLNLSEHRESLNPIDEYLACSRLQALNGWTVTQLAAGLAISPSEATRVLSMRKLSESERQLVSEGKISKSAAYALTRLPPEERAEISEKAAKSLSFYLPLPSGEGRGEGFRIGFKGELTRDELNRRARKSRKQEQAKSRRVSFPVTGGMVSVQSEAGLNLPGLIDVLEAMLRDCRKFRSQGLDITTAVRVAKDQHKLTSST